MDPMSAVNIVQDSSTTPPDATLGHTLPIKGDQGKFTIHSAGSGIHPLFFIFVCHVLTVSTTVGPPSAMEANHGSITSVPVSQTKLVIESGPLPNIDQSMQPGANQAQTKLKEGMGVVALDGFLTAMTVAKEASDWNPFLKAALGGVVAVVNLAKTVHSNWKDMQVIVEHIEGLLPILVTSEQRLQGRKDSFNKQDKLMNFAKRVLQGTKDADTLLGIYKSIAEALEQFKLLSVIQVQSEQ
ncbi:hypothetical protein H0H92_010321 [Tricholoma furcatifolium]|nr:hypothetical protein H0H92_010321 [Tricholoma furcatifolium]